MCHDREARKMLGQRVVRRNSVQMATAGRAWRLSEFARGISLSLKESGEKSLQKMDALETAVKEKKSNTWNKSCKESTKRETELFKMVEAAVHKEQEEREEWSETCVESFEREEKRRTKQETWLKRYATQPRQSPAEKLRSGTEAGPCSLGIHRSFRQGTRASTAHDDKAQMRFEETKLGQRPRWNIEEK